MNDEMTWAKHRFALQAIDEAVAMDSTARLNAIDPRVRETVIN